MGTKYFRLWKKILQETSSVDVEEEKYQMFTLQIINLLNIISLNSRQIIQIKILNFNVCLKVQL